MSAREVHIEVINISKNELQLESKTNLAHGEWVSTPTNVPAGGDEKFRADSDGFMTGVEGTIFYKVPDGEIALYFDNPYVGSNDSSAHSSSPTTQARAIGGSGDSCEVTYIISNK
ncbi:aegerolysin family protein [Lysinibacillus sp. NPDC047702]|uniref:aegerolysin family protein n=1 Tax=unclassified Lysinibacillus TaxID=2636778 RepID=UPI003CFE4853